MLPLDRSKDGTLLVAASDPTNVLALDDVRLYTRSADLQVVVATDSQIQEAIAQAWALGQGTDVSSPPREGRPTAARPTRTTSSWATRSSAG